MSLKVQVGHVFVSGKEGDYSVSVWDGNRFNNNLNHLDKKQLKSVRDEINKVLKNDK
jgi:hypothetical protein